MVLDQNINIFINFHNCELDQFLAFVAETVLIYVYWGGTSIQPVDGVSKAGCATQRDCNLAPNPGFVSRGRLARQKETQMADFSWPVSDSWLDDWLHI